MPVVAATVPICNVAAEDDTLLGDGADDEGFDLVFEASEDAPSSPSSIRAVSAWHSVALAGCAFPALHTLVSSIWFRSDTQSIALWTHRGI